MKKYVLLLLPFYLSAFCFDSSVLDELHGNKMLYGTGYAEQTEKEFKKRAFSEATNDIASQLVMNINSHSVLSKNQVSEQVNSNFSQDIQISSDIPIIGAKKNDEENKDGHYCVKLAVDYKEAGPIYQQESLRLAKEIDGFYDEFKKSDSIKDKENYISSIITNLENYNSYTLVSSLMGYPVTKTPKVTTLQAQKELANLGHKKTKSIDDLANVLTRKLDYKNLTGSIELLPFSYGSSDEFTPFSSKLQDTLMVTLSKKATLSKNTDTEYKIAGRYTIDINNKTLTANLFVYDNSGIVKQSATAKMEVNIDKTNKKHYFPETRTSNVLSEAILSHELSVLGRINKRDKNLLLKKGEDITLEVKASKESYIYILMSIKDSKKRSYEMLLPIASKNGKDSYEYFIPHQNSNLWITLGEYEVAPPFGVEHLKIITSKEPILKSFGKTIDINIDGEKYEGVLSVDGKKAADSELALAHTRGLIKKKMSSTKNKVSEFHLNYTTVER